MEDVQRDTLLSAILALAPSWARSAGVETFGGAALRLARLLPNGESVMLDSDCTAEEADLFNVASRVLITFAEGARALHQLVRCWAAAEVILGC